jgi:hypothetical protein
MGSWFTTAEMPAIYTFSQSMTPFSYLFVRNPGQEDNQGIGEKGERCLVE